VPCHKNNGEYLMFCPDKTDVRKPKGSCKTSRTRQCCFLNYLVLIEGLRNAEYYEEENLMIWSRRFVYKLYRLSLYALP